MTRLGMSQLAVLEKECKLASVGSERLCSRGSASSTNISWLASPERALLALCTCSRAPRSQRLIFATMPQRLATRLLLLAVAFADEADDTRAAAAADHLRADELKELLMMAGVEFG